MLANIYNQCKKIKQHENELSKLISGGMPSRSVRTKQFLASQAKCRQIVQSHWGEIINSYYSIQQVSARFKFSFRLIKSILTETQKQQLRIKFEKKLLDLLKRGCSVKEIAKFFEVSTTFIRQEIIKLKKG